MLKNISKLECKVNERTFQFLCDSNSPIMEVKEALFQFMKFSGEIEDRARAAQETNTEEKTDIIELAEVQEELKKDDQ